MSFAAEVIYSRFQKLITNDSLSVSDIGDTVEMPSFQAELISRLLHDSAHRFSLQAPVIRVSTPCVVVGDLHGNVHDLIRIFRDSGLPPSTRYLFLGDYVDKGEFSMEVIVLLIAARQLFPEHIFVLRGNHEFPAPISPNTLRANIESQYFTIDLLDEFHYVFSWLPVAAVLGEEIFCVHGGLSPRMQCVDAISSMVKMPVPTWANPLVTDILWADPATADDLEEGEDESCIASIMFRPSRRGNFSVYGEAAVDEFLRRNQLKMIFRAHQMFEGGFKYFFGKKVVTIFSSSNYVGLNNVAGYMFVTMDNKLVQHTLPPIRTVKRKDCLFLEKPYVAGSLIKLKTPTLKGFTNDNIGKIIMAATANRRGSKVAPKNKFLGLLPPYELHKLKNANPILKNLSTPMSKTMHNLPPISITDI